MSEEGEFIDDLELFLRPDDMSTFQYTKEALAVTGIDLKEHLTNPKTITHKEGSKVLADFLTKHKIKGKRRHYIPCGQNIEFDIKFVKKDLCVGKDAFNKMVSFKPLDTLRILTFLQDCEILPIDLGSLGSLVEYFGIRMGNAHDAKEDIKMTIMVYSKMKELMINFKKGGSSLSESVLDIIER